jgi:hypothetical protein
MSVGWERRRVLVTVKAYPQLGRKVGESVCVAGVDLDRRDWIRLNPLDFRALDRDHRFAKYQEISVSVTKTATDARPESFTPRLDSIRPVGRPLPAGEARQRRGIILPLLRDSMCAVIREQRLRGTSLAVFRQEEPPEIVAQPRDTPDRTLITGQQSLIELARSPIEDLPYRFAFRYRCADGACGGHDQTSVDWELGEAFRRFRRDYGGAEIIDRIRAVWEAMWDSDREPYLYTGSMARHPESFLMLGVFRPRALTTDAGPQGPVQGELPLPL